MTAKAECMGPDPDHNILFQIEYMKIRSYQPQDLSALHAINCAGEPGVGAVTAQRLASIIDLGDCLIAEDETGRVSGFILLIPPGTAYDSPNYHWFEMRGLTQAVARLYIDRIAIHPNCQGQGLGQLLYEAAFLNASERYEVMGCEVNLLPPNPASLRFHKRLGFEEAGQQIFKVGEKAVIYLERVLNTGSD